ncbi:hypothetical protein C943_04089 [Mariniradius saccharolyticus AK6]|uniref:Uncharacterized protein n=1 Tax=Mariniradius saccharolyticus AK6 TaxID=1239962 RepID=M7X8Q0_9BACT|nr:hypothetical protein C943_04089 [Mariniradius saccharolyticus AK6]
MLILVVYVITPCLTSSVMKLSDKQAKTANRYFFMAFEFWMAQRYEGGNSY